MLPCYYTLRRTSDLDPGPVPMGGFDAGAGSDASSRGAHLVDTGGSADGVTIAGRSVRDTATTSLEAGDSTAVATVTGMQIGVVTVQNETTAGRQVLQQSGPGMCGGHHTHAFAANREYPSDINTFFGHMGNVVPKILYAACAPASLATSDPWVSPDTNRPVDEAAARTFANQIAEYITANASITHVNYYNELKGYNWGDNATDRARFYSHYIAFAERLKSLKPAIKVGGPYTTGGLPSGTITTIHQGFRDVVVIPRPELVDFIAWDHSGGTNTVFYTAIYTGSGINLPHMNTEWYPGGWNTTSPPTVEQFARDLLGMATNPRMGFVMAWSGGSDPAMRTPLWNSSGVTTAYWAAMKTVAGFTRHGGVTSTGANTWTNAIGQTCTVTGNTLTVT